MTDGDKDHTRRNWVATGAALLPILLVFVLPLLAGWQTALPDGIVSGSPSESDKAVDALLALTGTMITLATGTLVGAALLIRESSHGSVVAALCATTSIGSIFAGCRFQMSLAEQLALSQFDIRLVSDRLDIQGLCLLLAICSLMGLTVMRFFWRGAPSNTENTRKAGARMTPLVVRFIAAAIVIAPPVAAAPAGNVARPIAEIVTVVKQHCELGCRVSALVVSGGLSVSPVAANSSLHSDCLINPIMDQVQVVNSEIQLTGIWVDAPSVAGVARLIPVFLAWGPGQGDRVLDGQVCANPAIEMSVDFVNSNSPRSLTQSAVNDTAVAAKSTLEVGAITNTTIQGNTNINATSPDISITSAGNKSYAATKIGTIDSTQNNGSEQRLPDATHVDSANISNKNKLSPIFSGISQRSFGENTEVLFVLNAAKTLRHLMTTARNAPIGHWLMGSEVDQFVRIFVETIPSGASVLIYGASIDRTSNTILTVKKSSVDALAVAWGKIVRTSQQCRREVAPRRGST